MNKRGNFKPKSEKPIDDTQKTLIQWSNVVLILFILFAGGRAIMILHDDNSSVFSSPSQSETSIELPKPVEDMTSKQISVPSEHDSNASTTSNKADDILGRTEIHKIETK